MRFYRNAEVEAWVAALLENDSSKAAACATRLNVNGCPILLTRNLAAARGWARPQTLVGHRAGIIASGQAKRLAADGLFVNYKPNIADWMLAPSTDIRASNSLETVQNQYQIQGLGWISLSSRGMLICAVKRTVGRLSSSQAAIGSVTS
ncbi:MAG: DUF2075 domain-containing protein [Gammaproteobacteria bacterium]|nr:DUF2075 domain-containing protein [Gammaproteobacteria bacterium]